MHRTTRCAGVLLAVTGGALALAALSAPAALRGLDLVRQGRTTAAGLDDLLVPTCAVACLLVTGWCWLVAVATVAELARLPHEPIAAGGGVVRRLVLLACGATLVGLVAAPAHAAPPGDPTVAVTARLEAPQGVDGLPLPGRPTGGPGHHDRGDRGDHGDPVGRVVVVRPGDSLWSLAAGTAPRGADVAAWWARLVDHNRDVVGPDPDLLLPGQRLSLPVTDPHRTLSERTDR